MTPKRALAAAVCLSLLFAAGCSILEPEAAATPAPTAPATQLDQSNQNLTDADLTALYAQTQLVSLDLRETRSPSKQFSRFRPRCLTATFSGASRSAARSLTATARRSCCPRMLLQTS
ncbi:MAG: hypothetical protein R2912_09550 [Eubacteriales bacterium]